MKDFKSEGIVFRSVKYGDSSLILEILTREKGLRSFIVSGVKGSKGRSKAAIYQHLNILHLLAYDKQEKLARIKEVNINHVYHSLTFDVIKSSLGLFILEVCRNAIKEYEANEEVYDFIKGKLVDLDQEENKENLGLFHIRFMLEFSKLIGFLPNNNFDDRNRYFDMLNGVFITDPLQKYASSFPVSKAISELLATHSESNTKYSKPLRNEILDDLVIYYRLHMDIFGELKSLSVLRSIF